MSTPNCKPLEAGDPGDETIQAYNTHRDSVTWVINRVAILIVTYKTNPY